MHLLTNKYPSFNYSVISNADQNRIDASNDTFLNMWLQGNTIFLSNDFYTIIMSCAHNGGSDQLGQAKGHCFLQEESDHPQTGRMPGLIQLINVHMFTIYTDNAASNQMVKDTLKKAPLPVILQSINYNVIQS